MKKWSSWITFSFFHDLCHLSHICCHCSANVPALKVLPWPPPPLYRNCGYLAVKVNWLHLVVLWFETICSTNRKYFKQSRAAGVKMQQVCGIPHTMQHLAHFRQGNITSARSDSNISSNNSWVQRRLLQFASQTFSEAGSCIMCRCVWHFSSKTQLDLHESCR